MEVDDVQAGMRVERIMWDTDPTRLQVLWRGSVHSTVNRGRAGVTALKVIVLTDDGSVQWAWPEQLREEP